MRGALLEIYGFFTDGGRRPPLVKPPMRDDSSADPAQAPLPVELAFVVQLRRLPASNAEDLTGRVEHLTSGDALRFTSEAELIDFLRKASAMNRSGLPLKR